ncbi:hypothetical protein Aperf_G00000108566 [Anoplocephala perfoliata]
MALPQKLEDCFYTGEVDSASNSSASYVAVDTCSGLRGAIFYENTTYMILPLSCPTCEPQTAPHIILPWSSSPIAQNTSMRTFWKPVDVMALMQKSLNSRLPDPSNAIHTIWLEFIVDQNMLREFNSSSTTTVRYVASVVNLVNLHFRDLPVRIHLLRTQIWNLGNRVPIEKSIKATLNSIQRYRADQISSLQSEVRQRSRRELDDIEETDLVEPSPQDDGVFRQPGFRRADITMLLTDSGKIEFVEEVDHLAIPGSICTPRATAVVRVNVTDFEYRVATLVSKSIAEILGIHSFFCPELYSCDENEVFSLGDISRLRLALLSEMSACLRSSNLQERESLQSDTCGNGIIDRGEECEPLQQGLPIGLPQGTDGSFNMSLNSPASGCCDPKTCLADVHAVCVTGGCCRGCQIVARGRLCRPARDQCDLPEFCSGMEPECPGDLYLENGMRCRGGGKNNDLEEEALCYEGRCPTRSSHCKALWGPSARTADDYCYSNMNRKIDSACGEGVVCAEENTMCGLLHCQNGSDEPILMEARSLSFFNLRTQNEKQKIHCQYVASTQKFSYVPEGASCEEGRFCFQNRCIKPTAIAVHSKCPKGPYHVPLQEGDSPDFIHPAVRRSLPPVTTSPINVTCAGRGVCTNGAFCLCPPGWHGAACTQHRPLANRNSSFNKSRINNVHASVYPDEDIAGLIWMYIQAVDKNPEELTEPAPVNTVHLISILAAVIACVFFCLCGIIFLYRRRNLNNRDFHHFSTGKNKRGFNSTPLRASPTLFDSPLGKASGPGTASTTAANSMDSMCLCNRNPRPGIASLDDMELHYHSRHSSHNRRHKHSSKTRSRRRKKGGNSSGDSLQAGNNGAVESGPELGGHEDSVKEGKIKFGSMPSYREDKMKNARNVEATTVAPTTANEVPLLTTTTVTTSALPPPPPLIDFSAPWPIPPPPPPPPPPQTFVLPATAGNQVFVGGSAPPWMSPTMSSTVSPGVGINMSTPVTSPILTNATNGMESANTGEKMSAQPPRKIMTTSAISAEESESTPQVTVIRENSSRQPERGILKNKHEGGLDLTDPANANSSGGSKKRKHSSKQTSGKKHRCSSPHFTRNGPVSSSSTSTSSSASGSRSPSCESVTGSSSSSLSSASSCSTSRATDDTNSTNFVTSGTNSGDEEGAGERGGLISDPPLEAGDIDRNDERLKCRHKNHRHKRRQSKRKSSGHRSHSHGHHHRGHSHRRREQSSSTGGDTSATNTSTTTPTTTTASTPSNSSPCHRRCHRRRRTGGNRRYRLSSEDVESSIGLQNHKVPTILCNAEQQTDEISLARASGVIFTPDPQNRFHNQQQISDPERLIGNAEDDSEWEEVECTGGSDCEECRKSAAAASAATAVSTTWNTSAVPPTPPSAGGLLSRQYKLPSPPPLPPANVPSTPYYCTTQLSPQAEIDPYYQPPIEDTDSFISEKPGLGSHLKYPGHTEEDDGLISNRGNQGRMPMAPSMNTPSDCYMMKDSDGLARKNSPGMPYIARHNYNGSDSDFSLTNSVKKSPTPARHQTAVSPDWLSPSNNINNQPNGAGLANHLLDTATHQWLDVAESDASSLPDASCDLVHLAQLSHVARINPNLSDLARQQERIRAYSKQQ